MAREPFQVVIFPFRRTATAWEYGIFRRRLEDYWQGIAGGGEAGESALDAARREAFEEGNIPPTSPYRMLTTTTFVPVYHFKAVEHWSKDIYVIPVYYFGVDATGLDITPSHEHSQYQWVDFEAGRVALKWDSDRTALWELDQVLTSGSTS